MTTLKKVNPTSPTRLWAAARSLKEIPFLMVTQIHNSPDELLNDPNWEETSHPDAKAKGHRTFENKETGEKLRHDAAKPEATGHKAQDHWHRFNPDKTSKLDEYLDANDNPVPERSDPSHLYPS